VRKNSVRLTFTTARWQDTREAIRAGQLLILSAKGADVKQK